MKYLFIAGTTVLLLQFNLIFAENFGLLSAKTGTKPFISSSGKISPTGQVFVSSQSGSWGDASTWGGVGVPGSQDIVIISTTTTVTLDTNREVFQIKIDFSSSVELNGNRLDIIGDGANNVLEGEIKNSSQTFNTVNFKGNGIPGDVNQTFLGELGCSSLSICNFELRLTNGVKVQVPGDSGGSLYFAALFNIDITVEGNSELDLIGGLRFSTVNNSNGEKTFTNLGTVSNGKLRANRFVHLVNSGNFSSQLSVESGITRTQGEFFGTAGVGSTGTLRMIGLLRCYGDFIISSNGTLDLNGQPFEFRGNDKHFNKTGNLINSGSPTTFSFVGNNVPGEVNQTLNAGTTPFPSNTTQRLINNVTVEIGGSSQLAQLNEVFIETGSVFDLNGNTLALVKAGISLQVEGTILTEGSTIEYRGTNPQSVQTDLNGAEYFNLTINNPSGVSIPNPGANPLTIPGTLRLTNGIFSPNGNLTLGNGATIILREGSLASAPTFGSSVNVLYSGFGIIQSALEIPDDPTVLNDLIVGDFGSPTVNLNKDAVVNGQFLVVKQASLTGSANRTLTLKGSSAVGAGTVSVPKIFFSSPNEQTVTGNGWMGSDVRMNGTGSVSVSAVIDSDLFTNNSTINTGNNTFTFSGGTFVNQGVINGNVQSLDTDSLFNFGQTGFNANFTVFSGFASVQGEVGGNLTVRSAEATLRILVDQTLTVSGNSSIRGPVIGDGTYRMDGIVIDNAADISVKTFQFGGIGQFLRGNGSFVNNTVVILGGASVSMPVSKQLSRLSVLSNGSFDFSNNTLRLSGDGIAFTNAGSVINSNSSVVYNGTNPQTLSESVNSYFNLTLDNPTTVTGFSGLNVNLLTEVKRGIFITSNAAYNNIEIEGNGTLQGISGTSAGIGGNWINDGSFIANGNTVNFNGNTQQTVSGSTPTEFAGLSAVTGSNLSLSQNIRVIGNLGLGADIRTQTNTITMPVSGTSSGTADVIGNLTRTGFVAGGNALSFGNPFNSIAFAIGGIIPTEVTVNLEKNAPAGLPEAVRRTYVITPNGGNGSFSATLRLHYLDSELNGNAESNLKLFRLDNVWQSQGADTINTVDNWVEKSGISTFSAWTLRSMQSNRVIFDFDGDRKTDVGIFRPSVGEWWYLRSSDGGNRAFQFGQSTDNIVAADYTGDGKTDIAIFRPSSGEWFVLRSEDSSFYSFPFGTSGDIPTPADFDGDGTDDVAIFRPSTATWYIIRSSDSGIIITTFGASGDLPVAADYDGDGFADIAIFRPSTGAWWINRSSAGVFVTSFGTSSDKTVQADYTGDGKTDVAFFRPLTGEWFILRSEDSSFYSVPFGASGDIAAPGDYDGDGAADYAVFRPSNATWYVQQSTAGFAAVSFGAAGDQPIPNAFVR